MGSKGSNTTTEKKSYQADPRAAAYAQWLTGQAQGLPGAGAVPLQGVEGFSPDQLAAFQGVRGVQGAYNPYAQRAEALNAEYGRGLDFGRVQDYYNQLSAGPMAQLQNQQRAQMAQATRNAVQAAGGTGASRIGVAQGNIANQQNLATGALQSGLLNQAVNAYQQDLAMKGAAAAQEANLGFGYTAQNYNDLGQLYGIGAAQQGLGQSRLNALYQQGLGQYQNPYQNFQLQSGLLGQLGNIYRGTETTDKTVPEASPWGTILGMLGAGVGTYFGGPGKKFADGGAVSPFEAGGGASGKGSGGGRSDLFQQMVRQYFPKYNDMTATAGLRSNPFAFGRYGQNPSWGRPTPSGGSPSPDVIGGAGILPGQSSGPPSLVGGQPAQQPQSPAPAPSPQPQLVGQADQSVIAPQNTVGSVNNLGGGLLTNPGQTLPVQTPYNFSMTPPEWNRGQGPTGNPYSTGWPGVNSFADGGPVDLLRDRFASDEGQDELSRISRMARERMDEEPDSFTGRFNAAPGAPDLYDPQTLDTARRLQADVGYNSPYRLGEVGGELSPPLPQARPPFEMFDRVRKDHIPSPYEPTERLAGASGEGESQPYAGGAQLPPMPNTEFQAPERSPWGPVISAVAAALARHGERTPSGHLMSGTVFGQAARSAGAGLEAGLKTQAAGREEDRKNYEERLRGETLANQAAMQRLPYEQMTASQQAERSFKERELALKEATPVPFGRNIWGQPIYAIRDPKTKQMLDTSTGKPVDMTSMDDSEEALRPMATAIANYEMAPLSPYKAATPVGAKIASMIKEINPTWDAKHYSEAQKTINSFATGIEGRTARSMNVAIDHLTLANELGRALGNGDVQAVNTLKNIWRTQFGSEIPTNFEAVKSIVGGEVAKAVIGSQYALQDREELRAQLKAANSPAQLAGVIANYKRLMAGQLIGLEKQYQAGTRMNNFRDKYLTPEAKRELEGMSATERGVSHGTLPPEAQKMLKEGQVTTFGNGQKWTLKNGKPERVQ